MYPFFHNLRIKRKPTLIYTMLKKNIITAIFILCISLVIYAKNDNLQKEKSTSFFKEIRGKGINDSIRIAPPAALYNKSTHKANIVVKYNGFPTETRKAFQYAIDIWASLIYSPQTINVEAYWQKLEENTLGQCYSAGFSNHPLLIENTTDFTSLNYPTVLAEKLTNKELSEENEADIYASFNSDIEWYFGTDGKTPSGKYDLVTVVLHELCHGLGFIGSFIVEDNIGSWGNGKNDPFIFDYFVKNKIGYLTDTLIYKNNSADLKGALVGHTTASSGLALKCPAYFNGPILLAEYGKKVQLYTPSIWNSGSSIYHADSDEKDASLMHYAIGMQASIHNPGTAVLSILEDLGWKYLNIEHEPLEKSEDIEDIEVIADFVADFETEIVEPTLHYSIDSSEYAAASFTKTENEDEYMAILPISKTSNISYYITAKDKYDRVFRKPSLALEENYTVTYGPDTIGPEIIHIPTTTVFSNTDTVYISADITDSYEVDTAWVEYQFNNKRKTKEGMILDKNGKTFSAAIKINNLKIGDSISYKIMAQDIAKNKNISCFPEKDSLVVMHIAEFPDFIDQYETSFESNENEFVLQGFNFEQTKGFTSSALHSIHPYKSAGENSNLSYTAQLIYPIKINKNHYISFREIALVEPGEKGVSFSSSDFYDYVVVEASKDNGKTWQAIEDGWDCTRNSQWEQLFTQTIYNEDSKAVGDSSLYANHTINILSNNNFSEGDIILIRFRLYSDPYSYGWGWCIDDLKIQIPNLTATEKLAKNNHIKFYPNPVTHGILNIDLPYEGEDLSIKIYDMQGKQVFHKDNLAEKTIVLPNGMEGIYILAVTHSGKTERSKLIVK